MKSGESKVYNLNLRTFQLPRDGFDPAVATARELLVYGLPPRPDALKEPKLFAAWQRTYTKSLRYIQPEFRPLAEVVHGPNIEVPGHELAPDAPRATVVQASSSVNWSGVVATPGAAGTFKWVAGVWKVPSPNSPAGRCDGNSYSSSAWIGIDGSGGSKDVLQAGTEHDEICVNGQVQRTLYAWWEWFPAPSITVPNFPVAVGDSISCLICAGSATTAEIYLTNQTKNIHTSFGVTATGSTSLTGNCAEWIVERPAVNGVLTQLPDYGEVDFTESYAGTTTNATINAGTGIPSIMQDDFCNNLSVGAVVGSQQLKCNFTLPVVAPLLLAWKGVNSDQGIYFSRFDGAFFLPQQNMAGVGTSVGPALAVYRGKFYMAWKGVNNDQGIYYSSFNGSSWAGQQNVGGIGTSYRPALAVFNDRLFMTWKGINSDQGLYFSSFDGANWAPQRNVPNVGTSGGVALAAFNGRLYMAWKGIGGDQGIYFAAYDGANWSGQRNVGGVGTSLGPALVAFGGKLFMAWKGINNDSGIYFSSFDGTNWAAQQNVSNTGTSVGPALAVLGCKLLMSWKGSGGDQTLWYANFDGTKWSPQQNVINVGSSIGGALAS